RWSEDLFIRVLPRHHRIIELIEAAHLAETNSDVRILEHGEVKMGELAFVMAHHVNGVSALHSDLVKETVFADLNRDYPGRIINQTNGITPRRWLYSCNPALRGLINDTIGTSWPADLQQLDALSGHVDDAAFLERFQDAKTTNKARLSNWLKARDGVSLDPSAMFDVQIKRLHEYKRQLMNLLETVALWPSVVRRGHT
ncbi:glycogen/starch/alpha-glucan phosphorylase, partial [Marinobacter alexandrii]|uniref:glycogen/starch/alpha-glucan phosphorylase n=1 Tax=Marinobacter alexandrii TaxID=2570351 RepID=UPI0032983462